MKAEEIIPPQRILTRKGNTVAIRVWKVPISEDYPEGINYSFQMISKDKRVLGYDNNTGEGHHKHFLKDGVLVKEKVAYTHWKEILNEFKYKVKRFEANESKKN